MKKILLSAAVLMLGLFFAQCSHDDDNNNAIVDQPATSTLFVNGTGFVIGENAVANNYNALLKSTIGGETTLSFTMLSPATNESITVSAQYEGTAPANNLFHFMTDFSTFPTAYAIGSYSGLASQTTFNSTASGTVKISDLGNDVYRLEFDNVVMEQEENSEATKTITGYGQAKFYVYNL